MAGSISSGLEMQLQIFCIMLVKNVPEQFLPVDTLSNAVPGYRFTSCEFDLIIPVSRGDASITLAESAGRVVSYPVTTPFAVPVLSKNYMRKAS